MKVYIKPEDIAKGKQQFSNCCPIARALKRKLNKPVRMYYDGVRVGRVGEWKFHKPAREALAFATLFDAGQPVKPGWVEVWK